MDEREVKVVRPKTKTAHNMPHWARIVEPYVNWLDSKLRWRTWFIVGFIVLVATAGTPHMLATYQCYGSCGHPNTVEFDCDYLGIWGWQKADPDEKSRKCARFLLM